MEHFYNLKQLIFNIVEKLFFKQIDDFYLHFQIWGSHFKMWKFPLPVSIFRLVFFSYCTFILSNMIIYCKSMSCPQFKGTDRPYVLDCFLQFSICTIDIFSFFIKPISTKFGLQMLNQNRDFQNMNIFAMPLSQNY